MDVLTELPAQITPTGRSIASSRRWELVAWLVYTFLISWILFKHEPWFDEAQAWLLARDADPGQLLTHYLRYEGSPGLWHYLLLIPAKSGLPYSAMKWLAGSLASAATLVFLWTAPFPSWVRFLFPFCFYPFYQYAVVARSYVLLPLLLFSIAAVYRQARENGVSLILLIILLANVSLHGALLAGALTASLALDTYKAWPQLSWREQCIRLGSLALLAFFALLLILQLRRPADLIGFGMLNLSWTHLATVSALKLRDAFSGSFVLSFPLLLVSTWWFYRRGTLLLFGLGTAGLLALAGIAYSNVWHEGSILLWWVVVLWISWPKANTSVPRAITVCWIMILAIHLFWSARTSWFDIRFPYSGSEAAARYIQAQKLDRQTIFAFGPKSAAILPYFKQSIFKNWPQGQGFWLWSRSNKIDANFTEISRLRPHLVFLSITRDGEANTLFQRQYLTEQGYELQQRFDGALYWKSWILEQNSYELYQDERKAP